MPDLNRPNKIIVHHTGGTDAQPLADSSNATAQDIDAWHKLRWPGFTSRVYKNKKGEFYHTGYHFVIEKNGTIVQCRDIKEEGAHCFGQNKSSIGICLTGNFDLTRPTQQQLDSFTSLFFQITKEYPEIKSSAVFPHRMYATKTCYGKILNNNFFNELLDAQRLSKIEAIKVKIAQLTNQLASLLANRRMK